MAKRKAPPGCYWRGNSLWGRVKIDGRDIRWPLHTDDPAIARTRRQAGKDRVVADRYHGNSPRTFVEAVEAWGGWIERRVDPKTVDRYACSLGQLQEFLDGKKLSEIDGRLVAEIIRARTAAGVTNATIKRDLVALSSVMNFALDQAWVDHNPVLPRMKRVAEKRAAIVLPRPQDIEAVVERAPGMIKDMVRAAMATGCREDELLRARRDDINHDHRQLTVVGKRSKRRTLDLDPFDGYALLQALPASLRSPLLFWHSSGESYKNFASQFSAIVARTAAWAKDQGVDFRSFNFHALRHWHAVNWLKSGRSIYELKDRLGHTSIKTTEVYLRSGYLTLEEQQTAMGIGSTGATVAQRGAQRAAGGTDGA